MLCCVPYRVLIDAIKRNLDSKAASILRQIHRALSKSQIRSVKAALESHGKWFEHSGHAPLLHTKTVFNHLYSELLLYSIPIAKYGPLYLEKVLKKSLNEYAYLDRAHHSIASHYRHAIMWNAPNLITKLLRKENDAQGTPHSYQLTSTASDMFHVHAFQFDFDIKILKIYMTDDRIRSWSEGNKATHNLEVLKLLCDKNDENHGGDSEHGVSTSATEQSKSTYGSTSEHGVSSE